VDGFLTWEWFAIAELSCVKLTPYPSLFKFMNDRTRLLCRSYIIVNKT
jgi:hypothetical protein